MQRIQNLLVRLKSKDIDGLLVTSVENVTYLSGFTGDSAHLLVSSKGCVLFTDKRYIEQAKMECHSDIKVEDWINNKRYGTDSYNYCIEQFNISTFGFESSHTTHSSYVVLSKELKSAEPVATEGLVEELRRVKDEHEIKMLKTACEISVEALKQTIPYIKTGVSEIELAARLEYELKTNGADNISFETLLLSGARTSLLHGKPGKKLLEKGDFVLFDFGALYKGYHADISRTFVLGTPNEQQKEVYRIIQEAEMASIKSLRDGLRSPQPDAVVREIIPEKYLPYYYQGLGHGVGLQIHEYPFLGHHYNHDIDSNMVLTIEPGIYIPGWGGLRIEDTVLVLEHGYSILTDFTRELLVL